MRPRSPAPSLNDSVSGGVPGSPERLDLRVHVLVRLVLVAQIREHAVVAVDVRARRAARPPPAGCPVPSLPVDSATSCSTHRPKLEIGSDTTKVSLSRPCCASSPITQPSQRPEFGSGGVVLLAVLLRHLRLAQHAPRCSRPPARRARGRSRTAPSSGRRCPGRSRTRAGSRARSPSSTSGAARVGDRAEARAVAAGALVEVAHVRQRLDGPAGLRGDDEQRLVQVHLALHGAAPRRGRSSRARAAAAPSGRSP